MKIRLYVINQVINLIKMDSLCFLFSEAWERESNTHTERDEGGGRETIEHSVYLSTEECQRKLQRKFANVKDNINTTKYAFLLSTCSGVLALLPHPGNLSNPD